MLHSRVLKLLGQIEEHVVAYLVGPATARRHLRLDRPRFGACEVIGHRRDPGSRAVEWHGGRTKGTAQVLCRHSALKKCVGSSIGRRTVE